MGTARPSKRSQFKDHKVVVTSYLQSTLSYRDKGKQKLPGFAQKGESHSGAPGDLPWGSHIPPSLSTHSPVKVGVITFYMYSLSLRKIKSLPTSTVPGWQGQDRNPDLPQPTLFPAGCSVQARDMSTCPRSWPRSASSHWVRAGKKGGMEPGW